MPLSTGLSIDIPLTTIAAAKRASKNAAMEAFTKTNSMVAAKSQIDHLERVFESNLNLKSLNLLSSTVVLPEIARNRLLFDQISDEAIKGGYRIFTNTSVITPKSLQVAASKYHNSRPDLVLYHPTDYCAYVIKNQDGVQDLSLKAGLTENKQTDESVTLGQLLGEMEKVAGDLPGSLLLDTELTVKDKVFTVIELFGLIVDFQHGTCKAYKLEMDFRARYSTLYIGDKSLCLNDSISRLFEALQKPKTS